MSLQMIRLDPDPGRVTRWAVAEGVGRDDDYAWHAILKAAFGEHAPRPFRTLERPGRPVQLLGYTSADGDTLLHHARAFADPAVAEALRLDTLAVKTLPDFHRGTRLGFEVRVRPIVRQSADSRSQERYAFLVALERRKAEAGSETVAIDRQEVYRAWVVEQLSKGGVKAKATLHALRWHKAERRRADRTFGRFDGPDVIVKGAMVVEDAPAFAAMMARGLGRHRAFGFGMILLSPA